MAGEIVDNRGRGEAAWSLPPVHPEGRKFGLIAAGIALLLFAVGWELLAWPMVAVTVWVFAFFRDPERVVPRDESALVAPADGLVSSIVQTPSPRELQGADPDGRPGLGADAVWRVSIFISLFDVHVNRAPIGGTVRRLVYIPGQFLSGDLDKASEENERQHMLIERGDGTVLGVTQIAGMVARRIVPFVKPGDTLAAGARIGLIRFGSRVDVYLPHGTAPSVLLGQRCVAGETVIGRLAANPSLEGVRV